MMMEMLCPGIECPNPWIFQCFFYLSFFLFRPFGVAILFAGIDEKGPQLFHMDPSGTYVQYDAKAIGSGSEGAQQSLQEAYHKV